MSISIRIWKSASGRWFVGLFRDGEKHAYRWSYNTASELMEAVDLYSSVLASE